MSRGAGDWYVRKQGRVLGPFNQSQLVSLRDRGQLAEDHDVSQDRRSWIKAAELPGVFARAAEPQPQAQPSRGGQVEWPTFGLAEDPASAQARPAAQADASWFIARGDSHQGPMSHSDVQRMIHIGELGPNTLVWKQGMPVWAPASQVPDFRFEAAPASTAPASGPSLQAAAANPYGHVPGTSGLAIASLVLGLLWLCGIGSLLATIFGAVALSQISRSGGAVGGKGMAIAGLILGIVGLVSVIGFTILMGLLGSAAH
jgi:GYF domain 2/Domain of unknown function (DUF4190)